LDILRDELGRYRRAAAGDLPRFSGGAVGYVGYEAARRFERLPAASRDVLRLPEAAFSIYDTVVCFDHVRHSLLVIAHGVEDGRVVMYPIAGTRPRGRDDAEDAAMEAELRASEKERAEHVMLVDLARNDIGRVSRAGTVRVRELMRVDRFSHVMHLTSVV